MTKKKQEKRRQAKSDKTPSRKYKDSIWNPNKNLGGTHVFQNGKLYISHHKI